MDRRTLVVVVAVMILTAAGGAAFFLFGGATGALGGAAGLAGAFEAEPIAVTGSPTATPLCDVPPCDLPEDDTPPPPSGPAAYSTHGGGGGGVSPEQVGAVVRSKIARVQACYEHALKSDPDLAGKVVVTVAVGGDGRARAEVKDDGLAPAPVAGCVASTLARLKYPASGGGEVAAVFPFVFAPSK
jgi:hypothetical protein